MTFNRKVSPAVVAVATVVILGVIQAAYWRLLVYREPAPMSPGAGAPAQMPPPEEVALGRADVVVDTYAGGEPGFQDGPRWKAQFHGPNALALSPDGALLVADSRNHRVRSISPEGEVTTLAGAGADGAAEQLRYPSGVAVTPDGALLISDTGNRRVCRLAEGKLTVLAGGPGQTALSAPGALICDEAGVAWIRDGDQVVRMARDGKLTPGGATEEILGRLGLNAGGKPDPRPLLSSPEGSGWPAASSFKVGSLAPATGFGSLRVIPDVPNRVLMVERPGELLLLAGRRMQRTEPAGMSDGPGHRATFAMPCSVVTAAGGVAYVADYEANRIRRVRLPRWLVDGTEPPQNRRQRRMRQRFGRDLRGG